MNATSRAILQTILSTDASLSPAEKTAAQRLIDGQVEGPSALTSGRAERLLVTQKRAAELLSVSRATVWRMTKDNLFHPVEVTPGTWRYSLQEIVELARNGREVGTRREQTAA